MTIIQCLSASEQEELMRIISRVLYSPTRGFEALRETYENASSADKVIMDEIWKDLDRARLILSQENYLI